MTVAISWLNYPADYTQTWSAMRAYTATRGARTPDQIWLCEHPPVYTLGVAATPAHLLAPGIIPVVMTDRGGQVTYHGPGQVIAYCMIDLRRAGLYVKEYVQLLEAAAIEVLVGFGVIGAGRRPGAPGVYVPLANGGQAKIGALGVKIRHGRSYHGLALNVAMDLAPYEGINPCGLTDVCTTDMATCLGPLTTPGLRMVGDALAACIARHLAAGVSSLGE
jgi:lipoyl(octanoyl) transferase